MKSLFLSLHKIVSLTFLLFVYNFITVKSEADTLPQLNITFNQNELNYYTYIPGSMELIETGGSVIKLNAEFKTRGATALSYTRKPSLNMKLKDDDGKELDVNLLGLRQASSFILDAMAIDRINMRNRIAFDIWNDFSRLPYDTDFEGRNGTVGKFVEVCINGNYMGIYCLSDKINRKLLDLKKPEVSGNEVTIRGLLYKNGTSDIEDQNTPGFFNDYSVYVARWHDAWELHEPEEYASEEAWEPLVDLYRNDNFESYNYVKRHFWLENLADYTIHVMALCIADNWGAKNHYFSIQNVTKTDERSLFVVTPWDLDTSLGGEYDGSRYGDNLKDDWSVADIEKSAPVPLSICLLQDEFREIMKSRWEAARIGSFSVESVKKRLRETSRLFIESGAWQRTIEARNPDDLIVPDLEIEIEAIGKWYDARFAEMDRYFNIPTEENEVGIIKDKELKEPEIYTLQGVRISTPTTPGVYIVDGKKKVFN